MSFSTHYESVESKYDDVEQFSAMATPVSRHKKYKNPNLIRLVASAMLISLIYGASQITGTFLHQNFFEGHGGLPSHYALPSGDKIPSVALGEAAKTLGKKHSLTTVLLLGVWQAGKDEVGKAVKVRTLSITLLFLQSEMDLDRHRSWV
jgi:hypothetical protein